MILGYIIKELVTGETVEIFHDDEKARAQKRLSELRREAIAHEQYAIEPVSLGDENIPKQLRPSHTRVAKAPAYKERPPIRGLELNELEMIVHALEQTCPAASFYLREKLQKEIADRKRSEMAALYAAAGGINTLAPSPKLQEYAKRKAKLETLAKIRSCNGDGKAILAALGVTLKQKD